MRPISTYHVQPSCEGDDNASPHPSSAAQVGLWWLMAVIGMLFFLLLAAYVMRMSASDWRPLPSALSLTPLWVNTALLTVACVMLQMAVHAARHGSMRRSRYGWGFAGVAAAAFVAGQLYVWYQLGLRNYNVAGNPANSFFYLLTGLHGVHMMGGMVAWAWLARPRLAPATQVRRLSLVAQYWHFLWLLWLVLFAAMANLTPAIAQQLCGVGGAA